MVEPPKKGGSPQGLGRRKYAGLRETQKSAVAAKILFSRNPSHVRITTNLRAGIYAERNPSPGAVRNANEDGPYHICKTDMFYL